MTISLIGNNVAYKPHNTFTENVDSLDKLVSDQNPQSSDLNFGFALLYEEWKQNILLSNGLSEDENHDW